MTEGKQRKIHIRLIVLAILAFVLFCTVIGTYIYNFHGSMSVKQDVWGQFGDYVGGVLNPLFSLLALGALLYTIKLQIDELEKSELALKQSEAAFKIQNDVMMRQQFETTFFQMLSLFNNIIESLESKHNVNGVEESIKGRNCFLRLSPFMWKNLKQDITNEKNNLSSGYRRFYKGSNYCLERYYRSLNAVIYFVDDSNLLEKDKQFYCNIIRSQFSAHELAFLFYHCLCMDGEWEEFAALVKKYDLLKYVDADYLAKPQHRTLL